MTEREGGREIQSEVKTAEDNKRECLRERWMKKEREKERERKRARGRSGGYSRSRTDKGDSVGTRVCCSVAKIPGVLRGCYKHGVVNTQFPWQGVRTQGMWSVLPKSHSPLRATYL